jgi:hypothetical protein
MIHFVTLFLTLTLGSHPVEIAVTDDRVASVEVLLDGRSVGTVTGTEWTVECDFGDELKPHLLVAVARDAEGREIDRVEQRVNLPRPVAEVGVALEGGGAEPYRARILWESVDRSLPTRVSLALDGVALEGEFEDVLELPALDDSRVHILEAELALNETVLARSEVAFGGPFGAEVSTELTAPPGARSRRSVSSERPGTCSWCVTAMRGRRCRCWLSRPGSWPAAPLEEGTVGFSDGVFEIPTPCGSC